jgi:O-antigen ligase
LKNKLDVRFPNMAQVSLFFIGLMITLPFLVYYHAYPINSFYQEWWTALLGMFAMPVLITKRFWSKAEIPRIVLLPAGMMLLVLVQFALGRIINLDQTLLFTIYLLGAILLVMLGKHLRDEIGLPQIVTTLAVYLLLGSELNALSGIFQYYHWHTFLDAVITPKTSHAVYGNLAQANHFASYITLGLISLGLLFSLKIISTWQVMLIATPLVFVLVLSGSRSPWLYLFSLFMMSFLWQRHDKSRHHLLYYFGLLFISYGLMHLVVQIPWLAGPETGITSVERIFGNDAGSSAIRLALFHEAWQIFSQFPLLGAGLGQFAWQQLQLDVASHDPLINGLYNNAHNIVLQISAETGLSGVFILLSTSALWLWQSRKVQLGIYHFWAYAILSVLAIHSLLEYPLWYAYFLGIAALLLGLFDNTAYQLKRPGLGRLLTGIVLPLGMLAIIQLNASYTKLEATLAMRPLAAKDSRYILPMRDNLVALNDHLFLSSYAEPFISSMSEVSTEHLNEKLALNERAMRFLPIAAVVYRQAWLLALVDQQDKAIAQLDRAIWAYPNNQSSAKIDLENLVRRDPEHFSALLQYMKRKIDNDKR